jgi:hypothetical protein
MIGAAGGELSSLVARLKAEEQRKLDLEAQIATAEHLATVIDVKAIRGKVEARLTEWRGLLRQQVTQTRQMLRKILDGPVTMTPLPDGSGVALEGCASYGKIVDGIVPLSQTALSSSVMPITFGCGPERRTFVTRSPGPRFVASPRGFEPRLPP